MIKKLGSLLITGLIVVGTINTISLNKKVFTEIGDVLSKKPAAEIPGGVIHEVMSHHWKFVQS